MHVFRASYSSRTVGFLQHSYQEVRRIKWRFKKFSKFDITKSKGNHVLLYLNILSLMYSSLPMQGLANKTQVNLKLDVAWRNLHRSEESKPNCTCRWEFQIQKFWCTNWKKKKKILQLRALNERIKMGFQGGEKSCIPSIIHWPGYLLVHGCKLQFIIPAGKHGTVGEARRKKQEKALGDVQDE